MPDELSSDVAHHFAEEWRNYDHQIRRAIPFYDEALELLVAVLARTAGTPQRILDLGVGTGNLAGLLLRAFPDARLTGIDIVPEFLEIAGRRLLEFGDRVELIDADIASYEFPDDLDVVVTAFVFHHAEDATKWRIYEQIYAALNVGGCMANADFVDSASPLCSRVFDDLRVAYTARKRGLSEERIRVEHFEHRKLERPTPIETQVEWLRNIGFADVECYWKYLNLAIFGGLKPPA
jgi:tRNA (cmo5U34)-methyltransferase